MKKLIILPILLLFVNMNSYALEKIALNQPNLDIGLPLMYAFLERQSHREFSPEQIPIEVLSNLLWATYGINRPEFGKRTAPTATNAQEIDVYVFTHEGVYLYHADNLILEPVHKGDVRKVLAAGQDFIMEAPISILIVADISKFRAGIDKERAIRLACMDGGIVSQNLSLFCAANKLATVPRAMMDEAELKKILKLKDTQYPILNHPVGFRK